MKMNSFALRLLTASAVALTLLVPANIVSAQENLSLTNPANSPAKPNLPSKKIIQFGWDQVYGANPEYIRDNIREMEKRPFNGIVFCLPDPVSGFDTGGRVFHIQGWNEEKLKPQLKVLADIKWDKFTDNFLATFAASTMDWFSDSDWEVVTAHAKFMALAAKTAHCKGIMFDAEPYGDNPWRFDQQKHFKTKSFGEYEAKVRQRGREFMGALSSEMPDIKILTLFQYSLFASYPEYPGHEPSPDPQKRLLEQMANPYALAAAFFDGMLEAAGPKTEFIDGNEFAYFYKTPLEFYRSYQIMRQTAKQYVAPELRGKFDQQVKAGQSIYLDYIYNLRPDMQLTSPAIGMTPAERQQWLEHNTYYALQASDEYVWLYNENLHWWENKAKRGEPQAESLKQSALQAVTSAQGKVARGEALGFDVAEIIKTGNERREVTLKADLTRRTTNITRLPTGQLPAINGKLDEAIYRNSGSLDPFVRFYRADQVEVPVKAATQSWIFYDDRNLYIAFRNHEPLMNQIQSLGVKHDGEIWKGDTVEVSIRANAQDTTVYHFILNPSNVQWDSRDKDGANDLSFNPKWKSAASRGADEWTVEMAIPWSELKMRTPRAGTSIQANLARLRFAERELTSWSQFMSGFQEVENFGTWKFE